MAHYTITSLNHTQAYYLLYLDYIDKWQYLDGNPFQQQKIWEVNILYWNEVEWDIIEFWNGVLQIKSKCRVYS